jgi:ribonucleoside-diphosphate reductase alpha chain
MPLMNGLSDNAVKVLQRRYLRKDRSGNLAETPDELFHRVAKAIASAELFWGNQEDVQKWEQEFYQLMSHLLFLPNSPTLMNAGTSLNQLSACFVLPVEDNMDGIFTTLKQAALIQQSGGGTGSNFSHLRPKDDIVTATGGTASGPVSFIKIFDAATEHIKQGGKRRGANMGILNVDHPDIEEFITSKTTEGFLQNFNISVGITDDFMKTLEQNGNWHLIHPNSKQIVKTIAAKKLWNSIVEHAWLSGDPGLIFLDTINEKNSTPAFGKIESTNPCGEVPLLPYESCNLGSINLSKLVKEKTIDWNLLEKIINGAVRFLDNVIEVNQYTIPEIKKIVTGNRKIGLGVMGWAELLIQLEISYDSDDAVSLAQRVMQFIEQKSTKASIQLAAQRGSFPNWDKSIYYPHTPIRNATCTSIAPTGTISIIADTSPSIEPLFALVYQRHHVLNDESLLSINSFFIDYLKRNNLFSEKILEQATKEGTIAQIKDIPQHVKNIFKTAMDIDPHWHLQHQVAFQQFTDNAVSKTINLSASATVKDVDEIYRQAWKQKVKGITIFRYNSKKRSTLETGIRSGIKACKVCIE